MAIPKPAKIVSVIWEIAYIEEENCRRSQGGRTYLNQSIPLYENNASRVIVMESESGLIPTNLPWKDMTGRRDNPLKPSGDQREVRCARVAIETENASVTLSASHGSRHSRAQSRRGLTVGPKAGPCHAATNHRREKILSSSKISVTFNSSCIP